MINFIRVVELWVPDEQGLLVLGGSYYGDAKRFGQISREMCFGRGEGLPGRAWEQERPIVLKELSGNYFRRAKAAAADGLTCAIAMPIFLGNALKAVMLIFCGDDRHHVGAIELWHHDAANSLDMVLDAGYYGGTEEVFEFVSKHTQFRPGTGLPGLVWSSGLPVFMADLGKGTRFIRAESAERVGINRGFALPCPVPGPDTYVLAFLSALATPLVRRFETWRPTADGKALERTGGFCEVEGALPEGGGLRVASGEGLLGGAFASGVPALTDRAGEQPGPIGFAARGAGLGTVIALPLAQGREADARGGGALSDQVGALVAWYF